MYGWRILLVMEGKPPTTDEDANMLPTKLFHDAIDAEYNKPRHKHHMPQIEVEASRHRMLNARTMLADLTPTMDCCCLIIQAGPDDAPRFEHVRVSEDYWDVAA